jgi:hypothetical protein
MVYTTFSREGVYRAPRYSPLRIVDERLGAGRHYAYAYAV